MRRAALHLGGVVLCIGGGVAVLMDADHLVPGLARQTHPYVVLAFLFLALLSGGVLIALGRGHDDKLVLRGGQ